MLTYELKKAPGVPLYEALYRCIRQDILCGNLKPGEKLPSKRALAEHLEIGKITVEAAYAQLLDQGYICSREKVGFFVEAVERPEPAPPQPPAAKTPETASAPVLDLTINGSGHFPFSVWSRLQREVILDYDRQLLLPLPNQGIPELRIAIADHLAAFRGMTIDPENILIGAGTDFLYNLLIQLLGRDKTYAVEEPGYGKIRQIYAAGGVTCISVPMDSRGHFEKHINRMRRFYQKRRNLVIDALSRCAAADKLTILEQDAGLHFLLQVDTRWTDDQLTQWLLSLGIRVQALSSFYHATDPGELHCLVVNYSGLEEPRLEAALQKLEQAMT